MPKEFKAKDLVGQKVRLTHPCWAENDKILPRGLVLNAVGFGSALHLQTGPCPACGTAINLSNVPKRYLEPCDEGQDIAEYPVRAVWTEPEEKNGTVRCSHCGFTSDIGTDPMANAVGPVIDSRQACHWRFCPGCGAGMASRTQIDPGAVKVSEEYLQYGSG